jgi:hypothetical protein
MHSDLPRHPGIRIERIIGKTRTGILLRLGVTVALILIAVFGVPWFLVPAGVIAGAVLYLSRRR